VASNPAVRSVAQASTINGRTPMNSGPISTDACWIPPPGSERVSADQITSMAFCSAIESPNVAISEGKGSSPTTRFSIARCKSQPMAAPMGTNVASTLQGPKPVKSASEMPISASRITRSPWVTLTIFMTPNISAMPKAYWA
jgi:hypothetical protein